MVTYILTVESPELCKFRFLHRATAPAPAPAMPTVAPPAPAPQVPHVAGTVFEADPYAGAPKAAVAEPELLPQVAEVGEIIDLLRGRFIDAPALMNMELNESTLPGVWQKYPGKIKLSEAPVLAADPRQKSIVQILPDDIGYWRPADFSKKETDLFLKEWPIWKSGSLRGLILDLRQFRDANNLAGAAVLAGLFVSPQSKLFAVEGLSVPQTVFQAQHQPLGLPLFFPMVVLTNAHTRGAAEALALVLQTRSGALLLGCKTAGEGGLFTESRLKSGRYLRMATARIIGADGETLLGRAMVPDVPVDVSAQADRDGFNAAYQTGVQKLSVLRSQYHRVLKEKEDLDLPLDNTDPLLDPKSPHDLALNVAHDVILGICAGQKKPPETGAAVHGG